MEDDYPLLSTPNVVALILREAEARGATAERCADRLSGLFGDDAPPVDRNALVARCATHLRWLREAELLEPRAGEGGAQGGAWALNDRGREALAAHPDGMDLPELAEYPGFAAWLDAHDGAERPGGGKAASADAYDAGFSARHDGAAFTDNPFDFATAAHRDWEQGWCEAMDEEEGPGRSALTGGRRDTN